MFQQNRSLIVIGIVMVVVMASVMVIFMAIVMTAYRNDRIPV